MNKLPVIGTVSRAYGFLIGEIATIVRLVWAPVLAGAGLAYLYVPTVLEAQIAGQSTGIAPGQILVGVIGFVTGIMATVALLQVVVFGDRKPGLFVYLWLGPAELRLILVTALLVIAAFAAMFATVISFSLLGVIAAAVPILSILVLVGLVAVVGACFWVPLRLSLTWPTVVAENNLGVERSWALTKGNALRLLGVALLIYGPYAIVSWSALTAILGADMPATPTFPNFFDPELTKSETAMKEAAEAFQKAMEAWEKGLSKAMLAHWTAVTILNVMGSVVSTALFAGAFGSAYTALAGEPRQ